MKKSIGTFVACLALGAPALAAPAARTAGGISTVGVADATAGEALGVQMVFAVTLSEAAGQDVTVAYATADGTAVAGEDYTAATGTITFPAGTTAAEARVTVFVDGIDEPSETFALNLSNAVGAVIGDGSAVGTIVDGDPPPGLAVSDCARAEGGGLANCQFSIFLLAPTVQTVSVTYATADGTAHDPFDYLATSGTVTFPPGTTAVPFEVTIQGDAANELDEYYNVILSNPVNAALEDAVGEGLILNDDGIERFGMELTHGGLVVADLAAAPGPLASPDYYRVPQGPYSSWEVTADAVSGDIAPGLVLERLAEDNLTVLQAGAAVGTGSARALRWQRRAALADTRPFVRVRSTGCTTDCGADDVYRLRAYETTATIPRFNNSATQATIVVVQNTTDQPVAANLDFWSPAGALLATAPLALAPHGLGIVSAPSIPALAGQSGSITITSDGPYGALAGKAVALEPATGFSFDSPLAYKPR
ncbi:MAG: Calx-beta domain-containing protein [Vicinamibacteria bacterium]